MKVLVIEDEPLIRNIFAEFVQLLGHDVDVAVDGRDGLARFDPLVHDLVITDFLMPGLTGLEIAEAIRRAGHTTPIVLISGSAEEPDGRRAAALSLDRDLLRELLGQEELRDLIDADALRDMAQPGEREGLERGLAELEARFRTDLPPVRTGEGDAPGYVVTYNTSGTGIAPTIPEPSTWAMMLIGFAGLSYVGWRRANRAKAAAA